MPGNVPLVSVLDYVRERFELLEKHLTGQLVTQQRVIDKVEAGLKENVDSIRHESQTFCSKIEVMALEKRVRMLEEARANMAGRLAVVGSLFGIGIVVLNYFIRTQFG